MAPPVSFTKATLSYPIYSVDFDPYNRGFLVTGGGGGEGRSGVSNKITLLDTTSRSTLDVAGEIELSRDEDSVTSLANLASKDGLISLTGINSSEAEQKAGKNEHLRAFDVRYPKRRRKNDTDEKDAKEEQGSISLIGKSSLFKPAQGPKPEQYQRLLRLSPAQRSETGSKRIGAVATGLAEQSQLVVFDATKTPVGESEIIHRLDLENEAADLDINAMGSEFAIAWCTDYSVYEQTVAYDFSTKKKELTPKGPRNMHTLSKEDKAGKVQIRPKYRSIRFLTDHHLLVLSNLPNKSGAELSIMHVYPTGPAAVLFHKVLPSHIKQSAGMDVCALDADKNGSRQIVVAVAGQDISIEVYTINYTRQTDTFTPFKNFTTLRDVHPLQMTALRFAPFFSPDPKSPPKDQYVRLASVSMGNTVVVDTFALQPLEPKGKSRYVLSHPADEKWTQTAYIALISLVVLVSAILLQSMFFPEQGQALMQRLPPSVRRILDGSAAESIKQRAPQPTYDPAVATRKLRDILHLHRSEGSSKAVVLRTPPQGSTALDVEVIPDKAEYLKKDDQARHWHELEEHEQQSWKEALIRAGEWTVDEGEAVLKGILFSSYAGLVGQVAGEAIRGM
ncbi:Guanine nucleotide-exchange factor SEC12 [Elsinoe australis]|uniref:Guanine nucleotide-exchange factor SEC12 n=1 Tax=Elsinoe australis TaxID=40998 RepID=A0A2P7Z1W8_9PEZI|nr:Guanine nucleotide-exchange factor SEC12 [Elsinoe australis]